MAIPKREDEWKILLEDLNENEGGEFINKACPHCNRILFSITKDSNVILAVPCRTCRTVVLIDHHPEKRKIGFSA